MGVKKQLLCEWAGYSPRRLREIDNALDAEHKLFVKDPDGGWSEAAFVQRWVGYNLNSALEGINDLDQVKAAHEKVKMQKTQLQVAAMNDNLVPVADVRRVWTNIAAGIKSKLLMIPGTLAHQLVRKEDAGEIEDRLKLAIREALDELAGGAAIEVSHKIDMDEAESEE